MTVLPDHYIRSYCDHREHPLIYPFDEGQLQPASYDVRLGGRFIVFEPHDERAIDLNDPKITTKSVTAGPDGFVLHPGEFVLGVTEEVVSIPSDIVCRIEGKSSMGRIGLQAHCTAGYIDPGFHGAITLEMSNMLRIPIVLRPGKLVAQVSFQYLESSCENPYDGRYQGDLSVSPVKPQKRA